VEIEAPPSSGFDAASEDEVDRAAEEEEDEEEDKRQQIKLPIVQNPSASRKNLLARDFDPDCSGAIGSRRTQPSG
jgi:hypothetical protein